MKKHQAGFTIVELIIATSVFSVMLLLVSSGLIQIGRVYYKGLITSKTQEAARTIGDEITRAVQFGGNSDVRQSLATPPINDNDVEAVCVGNLRYTYVLNTRVSADHNPTDPTGATTRHGLWLDVITQDAACSPVDLSLETPGVAPADTSAGVASTDMSANARSQARELLGNNMRLTTFFVQQVSGQNTVEARIKVMYGQNDVIRPDPDGNPATDDANCIATRLGGQFCSFSQLSTFATRRL